MGPRKSAGSPWEFHTFVLSSVDNYRTYGHALRFSDVREANGGLNSSESSDGDGKYASKSGHLDYALVVLSPFPFFDAIRAWLIPVVRDMLSPIPERRMSVEPRISSLVHDALAIRSNHLSTKFTLLSPPGSKTNSPTVCHFSLPGDSSVLPPQNFSMRTFFSAVNPHILISIFELLLSTGHLLFVSRHVSLLTAAAQSCLTLMWPLSWDFAIYIPVLPNQIGLDALNFPNAAITGMLRSHPEMPERLEDILPYNDALVIVDLDESRVLYGDAPAPPRLPTHLREKLLDRLRLIFSPAVVFCDSIDPEAPTGEMSESSYASHLNLFGSKSVKISSEDQVRVAFLLLLREICDNTTAEVDEFKAGFLASPLYSLYVRNASDHSILKQLIRMTEADATNYLLGVLGSSSISYTNPAVPPAPSPPTSLQSAFHNPSSSFNVTEAKLVPNEAALPTSSLNLFKSAFPSPNQRANELFLVAEACYHDALKAHAPPAVLGDWILIQVDYLLKLKRHHDCLRLISKLESEHVIFLCGDLMTLLMESLTVTELDQMSMRQSEDRLGDAARAFRETRSRQQPTALSPETKDLYNTIVLVDDAAPDTVAKFLELIKGRNINVNATPQGLSLLSTAASMGKFRMAALLLRYGAAPDSDSAKNSIAHSLCSTKPRDEISYLLSIRILCLALSTGYNINRGDNYQATPLSLLLMRPVPCIPLLKFFLQCGSDVNSLNVDACPPVHFVVKSRVQQLTDLYPLSLMLDYGANPLITEPASNSFRALIAAASDAITANLQPFNTYMEVNKYLSAKYHTLRALKSSVPSQKDRDAAAAAAAASSSSVSSSSSPGSGRLPSSPGGVSVTPTVNLPPLPIIPSSSNSDLSKAGPPSPRSGSVPATTLKPTTPTVTVAASTGSIPAPNAVLAGIPTSLAPKPVVTAAAANTSGASAEALEAASLANYAIVDAQYRQLVILTALVHHYLPEVAKRKRKGASFGFSAKKRSTPHDAALALTVPLHTLLSHHTTLSVDIRHHATMNGSRPSVAACFSSKMTLLAEVQLEFVAAFYQNDGRIHLDSMNAEDMLATILPSQVASFNALCGPWPIEDALLGNLVTEVLSFPVRLSVLFEDLAKRSVSYGATDTGKIQVLLAQLAHLRNRQDALRHESQMQQVYEEIGQKVSGIAQFSFMMKNGTTLLTSGSLKVVKNFEACGNASRVPASELQSCRAYLFATGDDTDNKGFLVLASDAGVTERRRIPLKKTMVFDIPSFSSHTNNGAASDCTLYHSIALVTLHPSSTPHEYCLLECPNAETKTRWLSLLWRLCFEGRNYTHKRHLYEFVDRSNASSDYEGWLDYSVDSDFPTPISTHYFSLRGNRLVATLSPTDSTPIVIIYLDEYSLLVNEESSLLYSMSLQPAKHLAPRYLLYFGTHPKVLSKYPAANSSITDWRSLLRLVVAPASSPSKM